MNRYGFFTFLVFLGLHETLQQCLQNGFGNGKCHETSTPAHAGQNCLQCFKDISNMLANLTELVIAQNREDPAEMAICNRSFQTPMNAFSDWNPSAIYSIGDKISIHCDRKFVTPTDLKKQTSKCLKGNVWSVILHCSESTVCDEPIRNLANAFTDYNSNATYNYKDSITIHCKAGYTTQSQLTVQTAVCLNGNQWSRYLPCSNQIIKACPAPFERVGSICIYLETTRKSWHDAKTNCAAMNLNLGSSLAVFKTEEEQKDIVGLYKKNNFYATFGWMWIGASDLKSEGTYEWVDGTPFKLLHKEFKWRPGEPDDLGNSDCVSIYGDGIGDDSCPYMDESICSIPMETKSKARYFLE